MEKGTLYLCATPIGNLKDITLRALETLKGVDYIVAEDTRRTLKLLNHYNISKSLISYHEHSPESRKREILELLNGGHDIALVSDAGMPGISDPGEDIVKAAHEHNITVTILPGATAGLSALVLSGLSSDRFVFEGFLPRHRKRRNGILNKLKDEERTIILYEAPHHLLRTLKDIYKTLGDRQIAIIRELTKIHEEVLRYTLNDAIDHYSHNTPRGEFVLVIEGRDTSPTKGNFQDVSLEEHVIGYIDLGISKKEAIKKTAKDRNIPKSEVYRETFHIKDENRI